MFLYRIENTANAKLYIGITTCSIEKRWKEHRCAANTGDQKLLYRAMRKYGIEQFSIQLVSMHTTEDELKRAEVAAIEKYGSYYMNGGYNLTLGGEGFGRLAKNGEGVHNVKLTEDAVIYIRSAANFEKSNSLLTIDVCTLLGRTIGVEAVKSARQGKSWKYLNVAHPPVITKQGARKPPATEGTLQNMRATLHRYHGEAIKKSAEVRRGNRGGNAQLPIAAVREIFYSPLSLSKTAGQYGVSKKMVLLIKQRRAHTYLTKDL